MEKNLNALAACLAFDSCNAFNVKKFSPGNSKAQLHRKRLKVLKQILGRRKNKTKFKPISTEHVFVGAGEQIYFQSF